MIGLVINVVAKTTSYFDQHSGRKQNLFEIYGEKEDRG